LLSPAGSLAVRQQQFFPIVGAVNIAGPQLRFQTIPLAVEQQQRTIAGGLEVAAGGAYIAFYLCATREKSPDCIPSEVVSRGNRLAVPRDIVSLDRWKEVG
jgi:hypothetical protein